MSNFNDPYVIITLLSDLAILIMAIFLLWLTMPGDVRLKNYRTARRLLAFAYIILATVGLWEIFNKPAPDDQAVLFSFTLIAASFQAFLFTFSLITLIDIRYMTVRRMIGNIAPIGVVSIILLLSLNHAGTAIFKGISYFSLFCYSCQLVYYVVLFTREYRKYTVHMDNFFSEDERKRLGWIRVAFYAALGIGISAMISLFVPLGIYILFTVIYTLFYVVYAMKYINYIHSFYQVIPALELPLEIEKINSAESTEPIICEEPDAGKNFDIAIDIWIERKGFVTSGITLDTLAQEFRTNRTYLSAYINKSTNRNFKTWIGELRIEEAIKMMQLHPEMPLSEIGEKVGITERVSFYRQFLKVTGKAPHDFRIRL